MLTTEDLRNYGADVDEGIARCVGKEDLYLKLMGKVFDGNDTDELKTAIEEKDYENAFEQAHKLKGALANLSLTPMLTPIVRITESLRHSEDRDYSGDLAEFEEAKERFEALS